MVLNQMLASYGDTPVAAMGVATKVNMLVVLPADRSLCGDSAVDRFIIMVQEIKTSDAGVPFYRSLCSSHGYRADITHSLVARQSIIGCLSMMPM